MVQCWYVIGYVRVVRVSAEDYLRDAVDDPNRYQGNLREKEEEAEEIDE